jgi:hypothetical protein
LKSLAGSLECISGDLGPCPLEHLLVVVHT